jgi:cytochrome c biogenesis protein CcdA
VLLSGLLYTLGRAAVYVGLGILVVGGLLEKPEVSDTLQTHMNKVLGPILILVGVVLLELIALPFSISVGGERAQRIAEKGSLAGAALLGMLFALAFCPVSAALFFGSTIGLCLPHRSPVLLPLVYGVGTALPVVVFAVLIALGVRSLGKAFDILRQAEWWARRVTGILFVLVGIYYALRFIFGLWA